MSKSKKPPTQSTRAKERAEQKLAGMIEREVQRRLGPKSTFEQRNNMRAEIIERMTPYMACLIGALGACHSSEPRSPRRSGTFGAARTRCDMRRTMPRTSQSAVAPRRACAGKCRGARSVPASHGGRCRGG